MNNTVVNFASDILSVYIEGILDLVKVNVKLRNIFLPFHLHALVEDR